MQFEQNVVYHIYNQGNNREQIFFERSQYLLFLRKMRAYLLPYGAIISWCLMPNHFHWQFFVKQTAVPLSILNPKRLSSRMVPLNEAIGIVLRSYNRNPVVANLVDDPKEWEFSSAVDYVGGRNGTLCDFQLAEKLGLYPSQGMTSKSNAFN